MDGNARVPGIQPSSGGELRLRQSGDEAREADLRGCQALLQRRTNTLEQEKANGRAGQLAYRLLYVDLVILDELGYLPFSQAGGALLFHLLSKLYEHTSVMITTNLSFSEWAMFLVMPR
jgi:hypothetical protein